MIPDQREVDETRAGSPSLNDMRVFAGQLLARREYAVQELQARLHKKWSGKGLGNEPSNDAEQSFGKGDTSQAIGPLIASLITTLQAEGALR